jgi:hypothetical protein
MSHIYGMDKMRMAVFNLVGPGSMKCRLTNAVNSHLLHISVGTDIPEEFSEDYSEIMGVLSKGEQLTETDAEHYAQKIVCLHEKLAHRVH